MLSDIEETFMELCQTCSNIKDSKVLLRVVGYQNGISHFWRQRETELLNKLPDWTALTFTKWALQEEG